MQPYKMKPRVSVHLMTLIALMVVAGVFVACNRNGPNQNGTSSQTTIAPPPSPSPTPTTRPSPDLVPGDTIIVIKGGSVKITVDKTLCSDDDTDPKHADKKFKCDHELGTMMVKTASGAPIPVPVTTNSLITVNGGGDEAIEVKGNPNKVTIKFKKAKYPKCTGGPDGEHCGTNDVKMITVDSPAFSKTCVPADKCEVSVIKK